MGGGVVNNIRVVVTQVFSGPVGAVERQSLADAGSIAGQKIADAINVQLGQDLLRQRRIAGNPVAMPR